MKRMVILMQVVVGFILISGGSAYAHYYVDGTNLYQYVRDNPITKLDPQGLCQCGPDITSRLIELRSNVLNAFIGAGLADEATISKQLINLWQAPESWDVPNLRQGSVGNTSCGTGSPPCSHTVTVAGRCWDQGVVNYWLGGVIAHVVSIYYNQEVASTFYSDMRDYTQLRDSVAGQNQADEKMEWFEAGDLGNVNYPTKTRYGNCNKCTSGISNSLQWHWGTGPAEIQGN